MDPELRRAWCEIVTVSDYEAHMAAIGQAQAAAELTAWLIHTAAVRASGRITFAGAGTGQMFDFLDSGVLRPYRLTFSDLNPVFLACLRERLSRHGLDGDVVEDDIEQTRLESGADLLIATLLLEHIDWRRGAEAFARLQPAACGIIVQENPPEMTSAVTPGRVVPESLARGMEAGQPKLVPKGELITAMESRGYRYRAEEIRSVADRKRLVALLFR